MSARSLREVSAKTARAPSPHALQTFRYARSGPEINPNMKQGGIRLHEFPSQGGVKGRPRHGRSPPMKRYTQRIALFFLLLTLAGPLARAAGAAQPVLILDGAANDWVGRQPAATDPLGDPPAGSIDLGRLWIQADTRTVWILIELTRETILLNGPTAEGGNDLRLFLDLDGSTATGRSLEGIGVDLEIRPGQLQAIVYPGGSPSTQRFSSLGITMGPTHSGETFEFRIAPPAGAALPAAFGPTVKVVARELTSADRLPDTGAASQAIETAALPAPAPIPLGRRSPADLRLLCQNVLNTTPAQNPDPHRRLLAALQPDLVAWQELYTMTSTQAREFVASAIPLPAGEQWRAVKVSDCTLISRWPILAVAAVDGNLACRVDLPDALAPVDLTIFTAHTPCCDDNAGRDAEHDRLAATWRNLMAGTGPFSVGPDEMVIFCGDFNMVGWRRQLLSLRDGDIYDNAANGPDFSPGRAAGSLLSAPLRHTHAPSTTTWLSPTSWYPSGKLDYILYSGDVAWLRRNYVLDTAALPTDVLAASGLEAGDSAAASDHFTLVADFTFTLPNGLMIH